MPAARKSPIVSLIQLLALGVAIWFGVTEVWPWLRGKLDAGSGGSAGTSIEAGAGDAEGAEQAGRCLDRAEAASDTVDGVIRSFRNPPHDRAAWSSASLEVAGALGDADSACLCPHPACSEAAAAVAALRDLHSMADGMIKGVSGGNLAVLRERADDHLNRARAAWR